jgi:hypothetical protein
MAGQLGLRSNLRINSIRRTFVEFFANRTKSEFAQVRRIFAVRSNFIISLKRKRYFLGLNSYSISPFLKCLKFDELANRIELYPLKIRRIQIESNFYKVRTYSIRSGPYGQVLKSSRYPSSGWSPRLEGEFADLVKLMMSALE